MSSPSSREGSRRQLAALLRDRKEEIMRQWAQRVLEDPAVPEANRLSAPALRDHLPRLIDALGLDLDAPGAGEATGRAIGSGTTAREHARDRASNGYSLTEALRELSHFRSAILDQCILAGLTLDDGATKLLHAAIDESMITGGDEMERASSDTFRQQAAFRERFIGILGHDLRSPIQVILLGTTALLDLQDTSPPQARVLERIASSASRMERMIADLLDVTRARLGGGLPISPRPCDLGEVTRQALDELEIAYPGRLLRRSVAGDLGGAWDPDRLAQMIANLVVNALDYSPPDTAVQVDVHGLGAQVSLSVNNQGPVIAPEVISRLFDPFVQGSSEDRKHRDGEGLGLGLFIAKHVVEKHGGAIQVTSTLDAGTTFTVHLPRAVPAPKQTTR